MCAVHSAYRQETGWQPAKRETKTVTWSKVSLNFRSAINVRWRRRLRVSSNKYPFCNAVHQITMQTSLQRTGNRLPQRISFTTEVAGTCSEYALISLVQGRALTAINMLMWPHVLYGSDFTAYSSTAPPVAASHASILGGEHTMSLLFSTSESCAKNGK